uniref:Uncharacterized protein n=1 Tax=Panagrolaimus sp. PS1159 TaxID=55785 RepID=A0AC35FX23_9BILA
MDNRTYAVMPNTFASEVNDWYMKTAFGSDDNGNMLTSQEDSSTAVPLQPATDNMILEAFERYPWGLCWCEFTTVYASCHGVPFPEDDKKCIEERLESVPGVEVSIVDGIKVFHLVDVLMNSHSFECSYEPSLSYDNSSIGVHTALEFEAALGEGEEERASNEQPTSLSANRAC